MSEYVGTLLTQGITTKLIHLPVQQIFTEPSNILGLPRGIQW